MKLLDKGDHDLLASEGLQMLPGARLVSCGLQRGESEDGC
jgi:hypothetical protein